MIIENNDKINLNTLLNNYIIYIPDMQRDYCWGTTKADKSENTLFKNFLDTLVQNSNENKTDFTMGLFYGYVEDRRIYLCDGQQRITSLYLILLYTCKLNKLNIDLLIHNNIPTLQYAVRDSSLFFLNDLVEHIKNIDVIIKIDDIKTMDWYFDEYNNDDTIQNIIAALKTLENESNRINNDKFISYILKEINFIFIDMKTRENGEETYVLLNTTGEPLTAVENLKPYLVYNDVTKSMEEYSKKWEDMELFFWRFSNIFDNRAYAAEYILEKFLNIIVTAEYQKNIKDNDIVPATILKHIALSETSDYYKNEANIDIVYDYFLNFECFFSKLNKEKQLYIFNKIYQINDNKFIKNNNFIREYYTVIAIIYYSKKFLNKDTDINDDLVLKNTNRFFDFFYNILERNMEGGIEKYTIQDVVATIKKMESSDIISLLEIDNSFVHKDREEKRKLEIIRDNPLNREDIEDAFKKAAEENYLIHRILFILDVVDYAMKKENSNNYLQQFNKYYEQISEYFRKLDDNTRSLFIKYNAPNYPLPSSSGRWHMLEQSEVYGWLYENKSYNDKVEFIYNLSNEKYNDLNNTKTKWTEILKYNKAMLKYAKNKRFFIYNNIIYAIKQERATSVINQYTVSLFYTFINDNNKKIQETEYKNNFKVWVYGTHKHLQEGGLVVIEHSNVVFDIDAALKNKYTIYIFHRRKKELAKKLFEDDYFKQFNPYIENDRLVFKLNLDDNNIFNKYLNEYINNNYIDNINDDIRAHQTVKYIIDNIIKHLAENNYL